MKEEREKKIIQMKGTNTCRWQIRGMLNKEKKKKRSKKKRKKGQENEK